MLVSNMTYYQPQNYDSLTTYDKDYVKKYGFLGCGFEDGYSIAEAFMMKVASCNDPLLEIDLAIKGIDVDNISIESLYNRFHLDDWHINDMFSRIFSQCVFNGCFFDGFLNAIAETKLLDNWFMSERFMSNVWAGSIRGNWNILCHHKNGTKESYRNRFRAFIKSLDDRGLNWTKKYLENDDFWGNKEAYWL